jgi:hypothetical protein
MRGELVPDMWPARCVRRDLQIIRSCLIVFKIDIVGGGVQFGPLGTAVTNRSIVPGPGDYDIGEIGGMIGRGNRFGAA